jgi:hypothetical protein
VNIKLDDRVHTDPLLAKLLIQSIPDLLKWQDVLKHVMSTTGAKAAMITLRDGKTCQLVDDVEIQSKFHSPLVCGFNIESVEYYLKELRERDPWADTQRHYYPFKPILMSTVCNPIDHPQDAFFTWLAEMGIKETAVFELNRMPGYWTAVNLFFEEQCSDQAIFAQSYLKEHDLLLREAWGASQKFLHMEQAQKISLEQIGVPACLVNRNCEVISRNMQFKKLTEVGAVMCFGPNQRLSFDRNVAISGDDDLPFEIRRHDATEGNYRAFLTSFDPDPLHEGQIEGHYLITFPSFSGMAERRPFSELELKQLTCQERRMLDAVRSGHSVSAAGSSIGVKRSRSFEIWRSVKAKLNLNNSHQLRNS